MWCRGREPGAPSGLRACETAPEKAPVTSQEKQAVKNPRPSSAVLKAEDKAWFPFEEFLLLLLLEPIPSRGVTGGHGSSVCTGNFLLPSVIPDAPNKRGRGRELTGEGIFKPGKIFFSPQSFLNIEFKFPFFFLHQGGT